MAKGTISPGDWCHIDVPARDRGRAQRFYREPLGWRRLDDYPGSRYTGIATSDSGILSSLAASRLRSDSPPRRGSGPIGSSGQVR